MKRIVATFDETDAAAGAKQALRDAGLEPTEPDTDNPFFDPTATMPEARGLLWGGLLGGVLGAVLLFAMDQNVFWIPRVSPIMTAGQYMLVFLGFGLGAACGGFLGGVLGTYRRPTALDRPQTAVTVPDNRVGDVEALLRSHGATAVEGTVTHHEHPHRTATMESSTD